MAITEETEQMKKITTLNQLAKVAVQVTMALEPEARDKQALELMEYEEMGLGLVCAAHAVRDAGHKLSAKATRQMLQG